jgi:hypothetical protein
MRKYLLSLLFVLFVLYLAAQDTGKYQIKFGLISAPVISLDMRLSNELRRIYVTADFAIARDSLKAADYYSFFMNQDMQLTQIFINGQLTSPTLTTNLQPEHFNPLLPVPALLDTSSVIVCYSFRQAMLSSPTDSISFRVKYWMPLPEWQPTVDRLNVVGFLSDHYWYPRNIETYSTVNVKLQSSSNYRLELEIPCLATDKSGIRTHRGCFQDFAGKSTFLKIIRGLN